MTLNDRLQLARDQLTRVQAAAIHPVDWAELYNWAFYGFENAVVAAAASVGMSWERDHRKKAQLSVRLHAQYELPDVEQLLGDLKVLKENVTYGEARPAADYSAEDVATALERYVEAVERLAQHRDDEAQR